MEEDEEEKKEEKKPRRKKNKWRSERVPGITKCAPRIPLEN